MTNLKMYLGNDNEHHIEMNDSSSPVNKNLRDATMDHSVSPSNIDKSHTDTRYPVSPGNVDENYVTEDHKRVDDPDYIPEGNEDKNNCDIDELYKNKSRKRRKKSTPAEWEKNKVKKARMMGQSYQGYSRKKNNDSN
ncbi:hypothetical protein J6590_093785, partial [Homalodisca vitripennis]